MNSKKPNEGRTSENSITAFHDLEQEKFLEAIHKEFHSVMETYLMILCCILLIIMFIANWQEYNNKVFKDMWYSIYFQWFVLLFSHQNNTFLSLLYPLFPYTENAEIAGVVCLMKVIILQIMVSINLYFAFRKAARDNTAQDNIKKNMWSPSGIFRAVVHKWQETLIAGTGSYTAYKTYTSDKPSEKNNQLAEKGKKIDKLNKKVEKKRERK